MQLSNKNRIAYLASLTLLFSYGELFIPRFIPFFRLGLGNIAILLAFTLSPLEFLILTFIKAISSCLVSGTLFTPFFLISVFQSVVSGFLMYLLVKLFRGGLLGVYGVSMLGSAVSALIQILLCSLYLGQGTMELLGPMLCFSVFSGILTAWLSFVLHIPDSSPQLILKKKDDDDDDATAPKKGAFAKNIIRILLICTSIILIVVFKKIPVLVAGMVLSFCAQLMCGRKIKLLPHISVWLFVIISCLIMPQGKVLFSVLRWKITQGALMTGIEKAVKLSALTALSQCAANIRPKGNGLIATSFAYFGGLCKIMNTAEGNLIKRIKASLSATVINE